MEQLEQELIALLQKTVGGVEKAGEFIVAEIPDVIQQMLMWYGVYYFIMFAIGLVVVAGWISVERKAIQYGRAAKWDGDDWFAGYVLLASIARVAPFFLLIWLLNLQWLKIWIAPKLWLIEYAADLASKAT